MDLGSLLVLFSMDLVITVFAYLLVPVILALSKRKYEKKKITRISIINCAVVWILFRILQIALGEEPSIGVAVFLWGAVGYSIMKKSCLITNTQSPIPNSVSMSKNSSIQRPMAYEDEAPESYSNHPLHGGDTVLKNEHQGNRVPPVEFVPQQNVQIPRISSTTKRTTKYCSRCGSIINPESKKCEGCGKQYFKGMSFKIIAVILCILLGVSLVRNLVLSTTLVQVQKEKALLTRQKNSLKAEIEELKNDKEEYEEYFDYWLKNWRKINFVDSAVVFIENDGSGLYHKFECEKFKGEDYWVHNVEYAKYIGFSPCPHCCD